MRNIVPFQRGDRLFDPERARTRAPGVRVALDIEGWCVERLAGYVITGRTPTATRADANREACRIARDEGAALLPTRMPPRARDFPGDWPPGPQSASHHPAA